MGTRSPADENPERRESLDLHEIRLSLSPLFPRVVRSFVVTLPYLLCPLQIQLPPSDYFLGPLLKLLSRLGNTAPWFHFHLEGAGRRRLPSPKTELLNGSLFRSHICWMQIVHACQVSFKKYLKITPVL